MHPTLSVITVSYNAEAEIEKTIQSVLAQTFTDYEYIFIDGGSSDGTVAIIESYRSRFEALGISYRVTSERDKGIYDAMNKGARQCRGKWAIMLNAGDRFVDEQVLADVFSGDVQEGCILYGDALLQVIAVGKAYYKEKFAYPLEKTEEFMPFCHQCVFVPVQLLQEYGFDTNLRITADYKLIVQAYTAGKPFRYLQRFISVYDRSGVSSVNPEKLKAEYDAVKKEFFEAPKLEPAEWQQSGISAAVKAFAKRFLPAIAYPASGWHTDPHFYRNEK